MSERDIEDLYPLSPVQQGLLYHTLLAPGSGVYVGQLTATLVGPLDRELLASAWRRTLELHPALRTCFIWQGVDEPVQVVVPAIEVPLAVHDWRQLSAGEEQERLAELRAADRRRGFDLEAAPLMRLTLIELAAPEGAASRHCLLWTYHHLILDGWSIPRILGPVLAQYRAVAAGAAPPRPARARPYRDYIRWLKRQPASAAVEHFRAALSGISAPTPLPFDRAAGAEPAGFGQQRLELDSGAALSALARGERLTLNTLTQAAWALLLARSSGEAAVVYGATVSGRPAELPGAEEMVGLFINTLPCRADVAPGLSLGAFLAELQRRQVAARQFEHASLLDIHRASGLAAAEPLFDSIWVFESFPLEVPTGTAAGAGLDFQAPEAVEQTHYPLTLMVRPEPTLTLRADYDRARFDATTIRRLLGHLRELYRSFLAPQALERPLAALNPWSAAERQQAIWEWNDTAQSWESAELVPRSLWELVARQLARRPEAIAVGSAAEQVSAEELAARALALAVELRARGVAGEGVVAVLAERSVEMVVALSAALAAGAMYLPLDPEDPPARWELLLRDAGAAALLVSGPNRARFAALAGRGRPLLEVESQRPAATAATLPAPLPEQAAYLLYTSGSTGTPKGVVIPHRGIVNRLLWMQAAYDLGPEDRVLQKTPYTFDVSLWDLFWPLATGARLEMARPGGHQDPTYLCRAIAELGVTTLHFVPSMLQAFVAEPGLGALASLRRVVVSGEALSPPLCRRFFARFAAAPQPPALYNLYGPTEASVDVSAWTCIATDLERPVPIGRPISNLRLTILDRAGNAAACGVAGELLLGGVGLARGYRGRPALSAERFVPDPLSPQPGERLYRSGDLARRRADGAVEYLGRIDHQVKLRGFRIELGEVEAALASHPAIRAAAAAVREVGGGPQLLAYVVADPTSTPEEWRAYLRERLPAQLVPGLFIPLDALPTTASGKVDRKRLPAPEPLTGREASTPPASEAERVLGSIWQEVLGLEAVGREDDFFALGGHSLSLIQVLSRLRDTFGVELALEQLFRAGSLVAMAALIDTALAGDGRAPAPPLAPAARDQPLPLSFAQLRMWLLDQLEPGGSAYIIPTALGLSGPLVPAALAGAMTAVVARHEVLRTRFEPSDGEPVQCIDPAAPAAPPLIDLAGLGEGDRAAVSGELGRNHARRPFDLARGPLWRLTLVRLGAAEHLALMALHHVVSDGWSSRILIHDLGELYLGATAGAPRQLPPLPVQYADFAAWQRSALGPESPGLARALDYWRRALAERDPALALPTDRPRPRVLGERGAHARLAVPPALAAALAARARRGGVTPFTLLLATFQVLLHRLSGQRAVRTGVPVAGRSRRELEGLIGCFVNTLVLRGDFSGDPRFGTFLQELQRVALGAFAHQDLPFEQLVDALEVERDLGSTPLFQASFSFQQVAAAPQRGLGNLRLTPLDVDAGTAKFELDFEVEWRPEGLVAALEYNRDLFDPTTIARWLGHYTTLLTEIAQGEDQRVGQLPLLAASERHQLLWESNNTGEGERAETVLELFTAAARGRPEATAALAGAEHWSYGHLERRVAHLGTALARLGLGAEDVVALLAPRGLPFLAAVLGIWHAGAAYLPLDPLHPRQRQAAILAQSRAARLLLAGPFAADSDGALPTSASTLESLLAMPAGVDSPPAIPLPEGLAYVIYTSGSTGQPKGAMLSHRGLKNHLFAKLSDLGISAADRVAQNASQCFDISVWQMVAALLVGASIEILDEETALDPALLLDRLGAGAISVLQTVPSLLQVLLEEIERRGDGRPDLPRLRALVPNGEMLLPSLCRRWLAAYPRVPLINAYGLTETSDDVAHLTIPVPPPSDAALPLGRVLPNCHLTLVEPGHVLAPRGVTGELWSGGISTGRGYLHDPRRTAAAFVPDPWNGRPGTRLYRTGDLARRRGDGEIELLGRIDFQVKVRGVRIELAEIESALAAHRGVRQAVVTAPALAGELTLVAHLVAADSLEVEELKGFLARRLPASMLPAHFVLLPALPLTNTGKVDRKALPAPRREPAARLSPEPPATEVEVLLAAIWAEVLGRGEIGRRDDFFALGGHSLAAVRVAGRISTHLGIEFPVRTLFREPVLSELALAIEEARGTRRDGAEAATPLVPENWDEQPDRPLSFAQERLWFLDRLGPERPGYNIPLALDLAGPLAPAALVESLAAVEARHEVLRARFPEVLGQPHQLITPPRRRPLPVIDLAGLPEAVGERSADRLLARAAALPFDLGSGPLLRTLILRLQPERHSALLAVHHIAADGWSLGILMRELILGYHAASGGARPALPPLPLRYADFARRQRELFQGERLERELAFFRQQLAGAPPVLALPTDRRRPAERRGRGGVCTFALDGAAAAALLRAGRAPGATLFMVVLAAWALLLSRLSGAATVVIGTPVAGRGRPESEALIGLFLNSLAIPIQTAAAASYAELLAEVRERVLAVFAHQDLPFDKLVEELHPERSAAETPIFQALFVLQNLPPSGAPLAAGGLRISPRHGTGASAKFDLSLELRPGVERHSAALIYDADLFDATTVERWARALGQSIRAAADEPDRPLAALPWCDAATVQQLLYEWNPPGRGEEPAATLAELLALQVGERPDAPAVVHDDEVLSYGELGRRATQLGLHLGARGVGPEGRVALYCERGTELVVAICGVLAAGGAYVPLEPSHPPERSASMLADSGAPLVLASAEAVQRAEALGSALLPLEALSGAPPAHAVLTPPLPSNLAYVIYTSGSTGRPKGVGITHANVVRLLTTTRSSFRFGPDDTWTLFHSYAFDFSVWEIFGALVAGGKLVVVPHWMSRTPSSFLDLLVRARVTVLNQTPSAFAQLADAEGTLAADLALRLVIFGGEALLCARLRPWFDRHGDRRPRLVNMYGITETTVHVTRRDLDRRDLDGAVQSAIGAPLDDLAIRVCDRALHPVPIGVPGELLVGGRGLARGYLGKPGLTAGRFLPDPWGGEPGARLYASGDLVRRTASGDLDYLGRIDLQVQIRGFRVELGEIETELCRHPGVADAVVLVREIDGATRLVAYCVARGEVLPGALELRAALARALPDYMLPNDFLALPSLPLTTNGKIDRQALDEAGARLESGSPYRPPRDEIELVLTEIWTELLAREPIGLDDDFFALGGHSMLAVRMLGLVAARLGRAPGVAALFQRSTLGDLAALLRDEGARTEARSAVPLGSAGEGMPLFLLHPSGGDVLCYVPLARELARPVIGLRAPGLEPGSQPLGTIAELAAHHRAAIRELRPAGPYALAGWSLGGVVAFELARQLRAAGERVAWLGLIDSEAPGRERPLPLDEEVLLLLGFAQDLGLDREHLKLEPETFRRLGEGRGLELILGQARKAGLLPQALGHAALAHQFHVFCTHVRAQRAYRPGPYAGGAALFQTRASVRRRRDPSLGWSGWIEGGIRDYILDAEHYSLMRPPHVSLLAAHILDSLASHDQGEAA